MSAEKTPSSISKYKDKTIDVQGKEYLRVPHRVLAFREDHPDWPILTEIVETSKDHTVMKASVLNEKREILATAHKYAGPERRMAKEYHRESAETGAIGRALGLLGYGTEAVFAGDEDKDFVADSPRSSENREVTNSGFVPPAAQFPNPNWEIPFGKFKGKTIAEVEQSELKDYCNYLVVNSKKTGEALSDFARELINKTKEYYGASAH